MVIDIHIHEKTHSNDSKINLKQIVEEAKRKGLDGICITDHDSNALYRYAQNYQKKCGFLILVGAEIFTYEGDILVYGSRELPKKKVHAQELLNLVRQSGGVGIGAHPHRDNNRGIGDNMLSLNHLDGVETFNGRTKERDNLMTLRLSKRHDIPGFGGSDAHALQEVGTIATRFYETIENESAFIRGVKSKRFEPVAYINNGYESI